MKLKLAMVALMTAIGLLAVSGQAGDFSRLHRAPNRIAIGAKEMLHGQMKIGVRDAMRGLRVEAVAVGHGFRGFFHGLLVGLSARPRLASSAALACGAKGMTRDGVAALPKTARAKGKKDAATGSDSGFLAKRQSAFAPADSQKL